MNRPRSWQTRQGPSCFRCRHERFTPSEPGRVVCDVCGAIGNTPVSTVEDGHADAAPEGIAVFVVTPSEPTARLVAPMLFARLFPERATTGRILHLEWLASEGGFEVVLEAQS